ncbi:MAG: hypothetical protein E4G94_02680 [ANME-2 cluster archaeon]|nr:MAG: hypothetical protein E4G94_02680 [ANME-2 cluster archaeon]
MPFKAYPRNLQFLEQYIRDYIEPQSFGTLSNIAESLSSTIRRHGRRGTTLNWEINIPREQPLEFILTDDCSCIMNVDFFCKIEGEVEQGRFDHIKLKTYNFDFRLWSHDKDISFRNEWDAVGLDEKLTNQEWKRVIKRFHIDRRVRFTRFPEPLYHLHLGGRPDECEYCWIPEHIDEPRIHYFPMDLVLICEFVLINFYPNRSRELREKPEWKSLVRKSQDLYLKPYIEKVARYINNNDDTLLGHLSRN